jgi:hypothetical protein
VVGGAEQPPTPNIPPRWWWRLGGGGGGARKAPPTTPYFPSGCADRSLLYTAPLVQNHIPPRVVRFQKANLKICCARSPGRGPKSNDFGFFAPPRIRVPLSFLSADEP